jgi:membrane associated rhomboid family serine protease
MGIYDREYYRTEPPQYSLRAPTTMVGMLVLANVVIFVGYALLAARPPEVACWLAVQSDTLTQPWQWWRFVTYGFTHDPQNLLHILLNMLALWFLGREMEEHYGRWEFLRLYLAMLVFGGVVWAMFAWLKGQRDGYMFGASGAVCGVVVLYALNFPRRTLLLNFFIPVPAWLVGTLVVLGDVLGAMGRGGSGNVAYSVHLAGAAMAFCYYFFGWDFGRWWSSWQNTRRRWPWLRQRPRFRLHDPDPEPPEEDLTAEVDRILEKISRYGEASLTRQERRTLEQASRQYQRRRQRQQASAEDEP